MAKKGRVKPEYRIAKIHMAAGIFVGMTRDAKVIAEKLNTSEWNVLCWAKTPEWETALEAVGYRGNRSFRVNKHKDAERENSFAFKAAHYAYHDLMVESGLGKWQCAVATSEYLKENGGLDIEPCTIYNWANKDSWHPGVQTENSTHD